MQTISRDDLLNILDYEKVRDTERARIIALKKIRRITIGSHVTLVFENRDTVRHQIHEMMRAERMVDESAIAEEMSVYNELIPSPGQLSATMMIEVTDPSKIRPLLDTLVGLDEHMLLEISGCDSIRAEFDERQYESDRISAVQYIRWTLDEASMAAFRDTDQSAALTIDHPNYQHSEPLSGETRRALMGDLAE